MPKPTKQELAAIFGHLGPKYFDPWSSTLTGYQCPAYNFRRLTGQNKLVQKRKVEFHKLKTRKRMRKRVKKRKRKP
jgi:hypothetical protein